VSRSVLREAGGESPRPTHPHFCTRSRKWGSFVIGRKTIKKRMVRQLKVIKMELRKRMHDSIARTGAWVEQMLQGHLNYFAVPGNDPSVGSNRSSDAASVRTSTGMRSRGSPPASSRQYGYYTLNRCIASTPEPEGGARCVSSARRDLCGGAKSNLRPYRDHR
jgi:hypothetical protein